MHPQMKRLYAAAKELRGIGGQSELAHALNASPQTVKNWETRGISKQGMLQAERKIGCSALWLENGQGKMRSDKNPEPWLYGGRRVPLISWVQAGIWSDIEDEFVPGDAEDWLLCPVSHGPHTFALRIEGESMYNPTGEVSCREGEIIFVDPDREVLHKSLVVAKMADQQKATFKQIIIEGERTYLKALNPAWPEKIIEISIDTVICGVVIFVGRSLV